MKAAKWRDLSEEELTQKARELSEEIFNLRFQLSMGVAKNPSKIGQARRDLARAYTIRRGRRRHRPPPRRRRPRRCRRPPRLRRPRRRRRQRKGKPWASARAVRASW